MNALTGLWRWFTLADAPVNRLSPLRFWCLCCGERATCVATIVVQGKRTTYRTCSEHLPNMMDLLRSGR